jgi:hypothetical protein
MSDLEFDTELMDLVIKNGDLSFTSNPSVQNGMIFLKCKCINVYNPILGIGFNPIGAHASDIVSQLSRWKSQLKQDGAKVAEYTVVQTGSPMTDSDIKFNISY